MPLNNGIITAPVDIGRDIAGLWGSNNYDLGYLITNMNWNKWAKYKPIEANKITPLTENDRISAHQGFTYNDVASDRKSYFHSSKDAAFSTAQAMLVNNVVDWEYLHNSLSWYRAVDFVPYNPNSGTPFAGNGYNQNVIRPFSLLAAGQEANSPSNTWWFSFTFHYLDIDGGIKLPDLGAYQSLSAGGWYWGVLWKKNSGDTSINFSWLTTEAGGSTKIEVGSPRNYITGHIAISESVGATTLEAYLCAACKSSTTDDAIGYIHLPIENASCSITNPSGEIFFFSAAYQDPRQGATRKPGFLVSYRTSGGNPLVVNESSHPTNVRILLSGLTDYAQGKSGTRNIRVYIKLTGSSSSDYRENSSVYQLDCSNPPASGVAYLDINPFGSSTMPLGVNGSVGNVIVCVSVQIDSAPRFYVNPINGYVYSTESEANIYLYEVYNKNLQGLTYCVYHDADNNTYQPPTYP